MMNPVDELLLVHYGKKGMKWGVRKNRTTRSSNRTVFSKSPKNLTNEELDRRIKRMETEKRYNQLNQRDVSKGKQLTAEILSGVGKKVVTTVATGALLYGVKLAVKKKFGEEAASMITKRGK